MHKLNNSFSGIMRNCRQFVQSLIVFTFFLFSTYLAVGQDYFSLLGASNLSGGTATTDVWSANNNQAGLAFQEPFISVAFDYQNRFLMKSLDQTSFAISHKSKSGGFGLSFNSFGIETFNTKKVTLSYGKSFGSKFSFGLGLDYINIFQSELYGSKNLFTFEMGMMAKPTEKFNIGAHVFNPIRAKIDDYSGETMPVILNLGVRWQATNQFNITADIMNDVVNQINISARGEYLIREIIFVRLGVVHNQNLSYTFGVGLHLGDFYIDFSNRLHPVLGQSPGVSIRYDFIQ